MLETVVVFFIFIRFYNFVNYESVVRISQDVARAVDLKRHNENAALVILTEHNPYFFLLRLLCDVLFLCFCIYLMFSEETWTPGILLLLISGLESYALYAKIDGTCYLAEDGYYYPTIWWRYCCCASSLFILTRLLELEKFLVR